jgi:prophage tail gpP-like protein
VTDLVTARVAGKDFSSWQDVSITASIEGACRSFQLGASGDTAEDAPIYEGDAIEIRIDRELVLTGVVEGVGGEDSKDDRSFEFGGRSDTLDIVDCSNIAARTHQKTTILRLAQKLCAPYGVTVIAGSTDPLLSDPIARFTVEPDETVYAAIERAARLRAVLIFDDPQGRLVLDVGAKGRFPLAVGAAIIHGQNKISASSSIDGSKLFSEYRIKGQRFSSDNDSGAPVAIVGAQSGGDGARRLRVKTIISKSSLSAGQAKTRANWEAANAFGRAVAYSATVEGWRDQEGELWTPGTLIEINDPVRRFVGQMLVVSVTYNKSSDGGTTCDISCAPEAGYYAQLPESPRKGIQAWRALGRLS